MKKLVVELTEKKEIGVETGEAILDRYRELEL